MITPPRPATHAGFSHHRLPRRGRRSAPPTALSATIFRLRPRLEVMEDRTLLSTFIVSNTADTGPGSLRQAIIASNSATDSTNTLDFAIPGDGVQTIAPASPLPAITQAVLIDGFSQPGYAGTPLIELSGNQAGTADGLTITGSGVAVRGLDINNFSQGAGSSPGRAARAGRLASMCARNWPWVGRRWRKMILRGRGNILNSRCLRRAIWAKPGICSPIKAIFITGSAARPPVWATKNPPVNTGSRRQISRVIFRR